MTELKDILRTEKNLHIKDGTKCLIVYEEQGKTYINKAPVYNGGFHTNSVKALLTEDEVLDLVDRVGDYFINFDLEGYTRGTLILTDPNPKGLLKDKFSIRRFFHENTLSVDWYGRTLRRRPRTYFYKVGRGRVYLSYRYEKYSVVNAEMIKLYILWHNLIVSDFVKLLKEHKYD